MGQIVPAVLVHLRRCLVALEEQLPDIVMCGSEEPFQGLVLLRIEFPQKGKSGSGMEGSGELTSRGSH